jgi:hypothetical protein
MTQTALAADIRLILYDQEAKTEQWSRSSQDGCSFGLQVKRFAALPCAA